MQEHGLGAVLAKDERFEADSKTPTRREESRGGTILYGRGE